MGKDVYWMVSDRDQKYKKETRDPNVSTRVCPYIYRYKLFIAHLFLKTISVMYSVNKFLSETCITLLYNCYGFRYKED
jgi:hypothetical protein